MLGLPDLRQNTINKFLNASYSILHSKKKIVGNIHLWERPQQGIVVINDC